MSSVRVLVGTKKGAFIMTADGARKSWDISGPHFGGWEMYHLKGSPADPNRLYAAVMSQTGRGADGLYRSDNGGESWTGGSARTITWTSSAVTNVKLEYTLNGSPDHRTTSAFLPTSSVPMS